MIQYNPLERIVYISIPEEAARTIGSLTIDTSILLPVELPPDSEAVDLEELSWEMIISGMLKICAYDPGHKDLDYFRQFIHAVQPNLTAELTQAGIIKAEAGEYELAEEIFTALKNLSPDEEKTFLNLAFVYEQQLAEAEKIRNEPKAEKFRAQALAVYHDLMERFSESPDTHYYAGSFYLKLENTERAKEHFELFLGLNPEDERSPSVREIVEQIASHNEDDQHFAASFDLIQLGKEEEALDHITRYLGNHPDVWNAWFLKGWALRRLSRYKEAEEALKRCSDLEKGHVDVFNELAICQMELEKFLESKESLKKALALEPENVKIISNFGVLALKMQNAEEAAGFFRAAHEIDPKDPVAKQYLERLEAPRGKE